MSRVYTDKYNTIYLDGGLVNGKRERLSTKKKATKRLLDWFEKNFNSEFERLYQDKYGDDLNFDVTFEKYGQGIIKLTHKLRTEETQKEVQQKFDTLCKFFGNMQIRHIKSTQILTWQNSCGFAPKTISDYRSYLNLILEYAFNDEIINRNPMAKVKAPEITPVKEKVFYYEKDMVKLLQASKGVIHDIITTFLFTGLRGGELIALKWSDIDFENKVMTVQRSIRDGREKGTKTGEIRFIPLFLPAYEALRRQQKRTGLDEYVFLNQYGNVYRNQEGILKSFKRICKLADVTVGTLHDLRRSCNTLLKQSGVNPDVIQDIMGHASEEVNRKHYTGKIEVDTSIYDRFAV